MKKKFPSSGTTFLVTGASSGVGRFIAYELASRRFKLVLVGRLEAALQVTKRVCQEKGAPQVNVLSCDLSEPGGPETLLEWLFIHKIAIAGLVNNAGAGLSGEFLHTDWNTEKKLIQLLQLTPLRLAKAFLPSWIEAGSGAILNVSSTGAFQPGPLTSVYYASKAFLHSWSLALREETRKTGIVVTTLAPGAVKTEFATRAGKANLKKAMLPEKVAKTAVQAWCHGTALSIPGWKNRLLVFLSRILPATLSAGVVRRIQESVRTL